MSTLGCVVSLPMIAVFLGQFQSPSDFWSSCHIVFFDATISHCGEKIRKNQEHWEICWLSTLSIKTLKLQVQTVCPIVLELGSVENLIIAVVSWDDFELEYSVWSSGDSHVLKSSHKEEIYQFLHLLNNVTGILKFGMVQNGTKFVKVT